MEFTTKNSIVMSAKLSYSISSAARLLGTHPLVVEAIIKGGYGLPTYTNPHGDTRILASDIRKFRDTHVARVLLSINN